MRIRRSNIYFLHLTRFSIYFAEFVLVVMGALNRTLCINFQSQTSLEQKWNYIQVYNAAHFSHSLRWQIKIDSLFLHLIGAYCKGINSLFFFFLYLGTKKKDVKKIGLFYFRFFFTFQKKKKDGIFIAR